MKIIVVRLLFLISLISCVDAAAGRTRLYKVLSDDFAIRLNLNYCNGQTACLCYKSSVSDVKAYNKAAVNLEVLCDNPRDAFICARQKIFTPPSSNETEKSNLVIFTSALKDQIKTRVHYENVNSLSFYVNINQKNVKIGNSESLVISEFWQFRYKSLDQRIIKFLVSSCEGNVVITTNNLEEVILDDKGEDTSLWETVTAYLYNTGDKALDVATTALRILGGVLQVDIWGPPPATTPLPPFENITIDCETDTNVTSTPKKMT